MAGMMPTPQATSPRSAIPIERSEKPKIFPFCPEVACQLARMAAMGPRFRIHHVKRRVAPRERQDDLGHEEEQAAEGDEEGHDEVKTQHRDEAIAAEKERREAHGLAARRVEAHA